MNERRLTQEAKEYLNKKDEERIEYCKSDKWIGYKAAVQTLEYIEDKFNEPSQMRPEGLLLYGDAANGKTAILKKLYSKYCTSNKFLENDKEKIYQIPIIYLNAPSSPDISKLYTYILNELMVPHKEKDVVLVKQKQVEHYLTKMNTKMILIDEIHSALTGNMVKQRTFVNELKLLSNRLSLPIILAGTKDAHSALASGAELDSRFPSLELPRWSHGKKFRSFLATYESCLPLKKASNIADDLELVNALYYQSEGLIGKAVNLLKKASVKAIKSGREQITLQDIEYLPQL